MKIKEKKFDSVKLMRSIRNKINKDIEKMSNEEIKEYFRVRKEKFDKSKVVK